jgi:hypothetical protein
MVNLGVKRAEKRKQRIEALKIKTKLPMWQQCTLEVAKPSNPVTITNITKCFFRISLLKDNFLFILD